MADAITDLTRVIFLCTPNNPTGTVLHTDEVEEFLARVPEDVIAVMDEAYCHFNRGASAVDGLTLLDDHPNVVVLRAFSRPMGWLGCGLVSPSPTPRLVTTCVASPLRSR